MEVKGLNDVIPLHFSIPIVSVMLILGLVFAFGFKSSSQPPSFDFDDEKKGDQQGSGKKKKRKKKPEQNNKQTVSEIPVKEAVVTEVKETKPKKSNKSKKQASTKPAPGLLKKDVRNLKDYLESENGENEWSTVSSRKDKKNKQASQGNALQETNNQEATEPVLVTKAVESTEAAVPEVKKPAVTSEKTSKKKKGKKKPVEDDHLGEKHEPKQPESPRDEVDKIPPKPEEEKVLVTSQSPKDAEKNADDGKQGEEAPVADKKKESPKKGKTKNASESQVDASPAPEEKFPEKEIGSEDVEPPPQTITDNQAAVDSVELKSQPVAERVEAIEQSADDASKKSKKKSKKKKKVLNSEDPAEKEQVLDEVAVNNKPSNSEQSFEAKQPVTDAIEAIQNSPSQSKKKTKKSKNKSKSNEGTSQEAPIEVTPEPPAIETSNSSEAISVDPKPEPTEAVVPPPESQAHETNTEEKKGAWKDATKPKKKKVRRDL
ncbi:uncharacterized protein DDB_G0286299-like [Anneissia japonica]|uniref:uncharacterized protein DDB_G0286299-like n=1 Tax=Anneissia japonica TaxID=1529436 RepID=UPI001425B3A2|nr:uncharacterized protein DDB_G0286299-like [Anneissia japonica]